MKVKLVTLILPHYVHSAQEPCAGALTVLPLAQSRIIVPYSSVLKSDNFSQIYEDNTSLFTNPDPDKCPISGCYLEIIEGTEPNLNYIKPLSATDLWKLQVSTG